jgi:hypothetical protein
MFEIEEKLEIISEEIEQKFPKEYGEFTKITNAVINHSLFNRLNTVENIKVYSEFQVWCVWDFMSILKVVQNLVFTNSIMWIPPKNTTLGYNLYKLLMTEETDKSHPEVKTQRTSHFELFIYAMQKMKADTSLISKFLGEIQKSEDLESILNNLNVNKSIKKFLAINHRLIKENPKNAVALLSLTRENFLPAVFKAVVENSTINTKIIEPFIWYHKRHIQLDEGVHGPIADELFNEYISNDEDILLSLKCSIESLSARYELLSEIEGNLI